MRKVSGIVLLASLLLSPASCLAQKWSESELAVFETIKGQWNAVMKQEYEKAKKYLHESHLGWDYREPIPRNKEAVDKWSRYLGEDAKLNLIELAPVGFVIQGNTAVAHYYYSLAVEPKEGPRKTMHGRFTDILIKTDMGWKFIAWHGGDDPRLKEE